MLVTRQFSFAAAHHLTDYKGACERPHGHTYKLAITVEGPVKSDGLVLDFVDLKKIVNERVIDLVDHTDLNDRFKNPSAELISIGIWEQLKDIGAATNTAVKLRKVKLWEGETTYVTYEGS